MRFRQRHIPFSIAFILVASFTATHASKESPADVPDSKASRFALTESVDSASPTPSSVKSAATVGKKDAPFDGKDGRPHAGPFVETEAERDRKKAKESGEDDVPKAGTKPGPKDTTKSETLNKGWGEDIPKSNDGVMDDRNRDGPKEGTRGTEGGISEKSRGKQGTSMGKSEEKTPEEPKEAPPLPHSEQEKLSGAEEPVSTDNDDDDKPRAKVEDLELGGLTKPEDLPDKPHNIPHPNPNTPPKDDPLEIKTPEASTTTTIPEMSGIIQPLHSFLFSLTMIIFSEIGDKTFLVAALMAMKHPPLLVFSAAFAALCVMTILSALLGHAVPTLLPVRFTSFLAAILFLIFGAKMLREGYAMSPDEGVGEEMKEVEMELEEKEQLARKLGRRRSSVTPYMLEAGRTGSRKTRSNSRLPAPPESPPSSPDSRSPSPSRSTGLVGVLAGVNNLFSLLLSPAWVQTFVMTFLGEWGDRSQIATIAMSTGQDYWWVSGGALIGHSLCTAAAVVGGRAIAGKVSLRVVTLGGAVAFLAFGFIYLAEAIYYK